LGGIILEGDPGIGKTTLWNVGVERALAAGRVVLQCRPTEAEAKLGFASLADLLSPVIDDLVAVLPEPQRRALDVALLREVPAGARPDRRAVATAVLSSLRYLAAQDLVVVAIDDVQWLDRASAAALTFALRRLLDVPLRVLVAVRVQDGVAPDVLGLKRHTPPRVEHLRLGPLSLGAIQQVIRTQLGLVVPRPTLRRILQASEGNPLFALELARALEETGLRAGPGEPLAVPDTLSALIGRRLKRLPAGGREALLVVASLGTAELESVRQVIGDEGPRGAEAAERAGIVTLESGRVTFTHPLLASTVYSSAAPAQRRAVHARLAAVVRDPEVRARHLALASSEPREDVAAAVGSAARVAELRGALEVAVELAELACRHTPADRLAERARRTLTLSDYAFRSGDTERARQLVEEVLEGHPEGDLRATALELEARLLHVAGTAEEAVGLCREALEHVGGDNLLRARVHATLACVSWYDFQLAKKHARAALDLLERADDPDPEVLGQALLGFIEAEFYTGNGLAMDAVQQALALERRAPAASVADRVSAAVGAWLKLDGDLEGARHWLEASHRTAVEEGDDGSLPYVIGHMPQLELWAGNWTEAERYAREHLELAEAMAQSDQRRQALYNLANIHAHQGRVEEARAEADELRADAEREGELWGLGNALSVLGFLELSTGNPDAAARDLRRSLGLWEAMGRTEPLRGSGDLAEALIELGRLDEAKRLTETLESRARAANRVPLLAIAASYRGLLRAELHDLDGALGALEEALELHQRVTLPFDVARTELAFGRVLRRRGERRAAKDALESARVTFQQLGAPLWEKRAEGEMARIPLRRRAPDTLTPAEEQVARLVAGGKTNREVAQALFISPKTVEANLARVYRKLGISSRAELGVRIAELGERVGASKP
jgi:ATP/maltotriose-dependent transcriptional regulator MalT